MTITHPTRNAPTLVRHLPARQVFGPDCHQEKVYDQAIVPIVEEVRLLGGIRVGWLVAFVGA